MKAFIQKIIFPRKRINPSRRIAGGFALIILMGTALLMLPCASKLAGGVSLFDALFTATSATCVTGLVMRDTWSCWTLFGQLVIISLIQIGGLGFITIFSSVYFIANKSIGLRGRMMLTQGISGGSMEGIVRLIKRILLITFAIEGIGAGILACCFVPRFGARGIWYGVFHSISAFCNAGFDLIGCEAPDTSLITLNANPVVLLTVCALVVTGGLGFFVWDDIGRLILKRKKKMRLQTQLVLSVTAILILLGWALFALYEYKNPETFGRMGFLKTAVNALFQSVTTRTAGFAAVDQTALTEQSKLISVILMMIGGSGGSTAGGIKTVTIAVVVISAASILTGRKNVVVFGKNIRQEQITCALAYVVIAMFLVTAGASFISAESGVDMIDALYETASAYGTVGLSVGVTAKAGAISRWILLVYMYIGRVGIMTLTVSVMSRRKDEFLEYPSEDLILG